MTHYVADNGPFLRSFKALALALPWQSEGHRVATTKYAKAKIKYRCPECGANVWGKPGLQIGCLGCDVRFSLAV